MIDSLRSATEENPNACQGVLGRDGLVYSKHGPNSYQGDQELLLLVNNVHGYIYGHVLLRKSADGYERESVWVAVLVESSVPIDGPSAEEALRHAGKAWSRGCYHPMYAQSEDDVFVVRESFEGAVRGLAELVRRYDPMKRHGGETEVDGALVDHDPGGFLDLRVFDLYGLACGSDDCDQAGNSADAIA